MKLLNQVKKDNSFIFANGVSREVLPSWPTLVCLCNMKRDSYTTVSNEMLHRTLCQNPHTERNKNQKPCQMKVLLKTSTTIYILYNEIFMNRLFNSVTVFWVLCFTLVMLKAYLEYCSSYWETNFLLTSPRWNKWG